jgi:DtxR family Mn-dependent transcriptional regulator
LEKKRKKGDEEMKKISEGAQEALEILWISIVEEKKKKVKDKTVGSQKILKELEDSGLIKKEENWVNLTSRGKDVAEGVIRRHRLAERLFHDLILVESERFESPACKFEHMLISGGVEEGVCTLLGHPRECPHGRRIPFGRCCREHRKKTGKVIFPLSEMSKGQKAKVVYISTQDRHKLQKLIALGILPGRKINLIQKSPSFVFSLGRTQVVVDKEIASDIHVRIEGE